MKLHVRVKHKSLSSSFIDILAIGFTRKGVKKNGKYGDTTTT